MIGQQLLLGAIEGRTPTQIMTGVASDKALQQVRIYYKMYFLIIKINWKTK